MVQFNRIQHCNDITRNDFATKYLLHTKIYASARCKQPSGESFLPRTTLRWRHNGRDSVSNRQPHHCLLNRLFRRRSKKTSKLHVTGLCVGNSPGNNEFPAQVASNTENSSIWWRHHELAVVASVWYHSAGANLCFWRIDHGQIVRTLSTTGCGKWFLWDSGVLSSPLASTSWSNSLIIGIYSPASVHRHVLTSPIYNDNTSYIYIYIYIFIVGPHYNMVQENRTEEYIDITEINLQPKIYILYIWHKSSGAILTLSNITYHCSDIAGMILQSNIYILHILHI